MHRRETIIRKHSVTVNSHAFNIWKLKCVAGLSPGETSTCLNDAGNSANHTLHRITCESEHELGDVNPLSPIGLSSLEPPRVQASATLRGFWCV